MGGVEDLVVRAFAELDVPVSPGAADDDGPDLVVDPDGVGVGLQLTRSSLVSDGVARRLVDAAGRRANDIAPFVVADRVTREARRILLSGGVGYLDLRGHLGLRRPGLVVSSQVSAQDDRRDGPHALAGRVGLEVAASLLMTPDRPPVVRELARRLGRSPSTVSTALAALRAERMVDSQNLVTGTGLFWALADRWPTRRTPLAAVPEPDPAGADLLRLGRDHLTGPGWALADLAAAAALGAPAAVRGDQPLDFLVPDSAVVRRAVRLLGVAERGERVACTVRAAPVPAACLQRVDVAGAFAGWPTAHPLFVALDLAQDRGRGREILESWTPTEGAARVW